ncbi:MULTISPECIES: hypothetical protein [unclassified Rhizobium]|uniref:hypothetical protein n=1 Tax=unclassified Rhizobium TaxID=2613769 RepID=UPI0021687719|nr:MULTISPECIES: hypothetical protein [unclassified Rhizobium]MCS3743260.1 hypothetical protein [Rhizobium sp. BK661]MCS4096661.1 hypothetical protein [Rhizobium sp. BK176]
MAFTADHFGNTTKRRNSYLPIGGLSGNNSVSLAPGLALFNGEFTTELFGKTGYRLHFQGCR